MKRLIGWPALLVLQLAYTPFLVLDAVSRRGLDVLERAGIAVYRWMER